MALNKSFRVKDSLYVGTSGCFAGAPISISTSGKILSAGTDLIDIFQDTNLAALTCGNCIASFSYNGDSAATVGICETAYNNWDYAHSNVTLAVSSMNASGQGAFTFDKIAAANGGGIIDLGLLPSCTPTFAGFTSTSAVAMGTNKITGLGTPTANTDAATKAYVDSVGSGLVDSVTEGTGISVDNSDAANPVVSLAGACNTKFSSVYTSYNAVSANIVCNVSSSGVQGNLSETQLGSAAAAIDLGLCAGDNVTFATVDGTAGVCGNNIRIGVTDPNEIDTSSGNLTIDSAGGTTTLDDATIAIPNVGAGTDNTVVIKSGNNLKTDEIDGRVWGATLVDNGGVNLTAGKLTVAQDANTIEDSIVEQAGTALTVRGSVSAVAFCGNGANLTNVTATACFPTTCCGNIKAADQFFINDGNNKQICYLDLLTDLAGGPTGITVESNDSLTINGNSCMASGKVPYWTGGELADSIISRAATKITIGGDHLVTGNSTVYGNLSVTGDFTCIETTVTTTSALSVTNTGTGPALFVKQGGTQPIAHFIDSNGGDIIFADDGKLGIGTFNPGEKLTVSGNISACGNAKIDGTITACNLGAGEDNSVVILDSDGKLRTDEIDSRVWDPSTLVDGSGSSNKVTKWIDGNTICISNITDTGSLVTIDSDTKIDAGHDLSIYAAGGSIYSSEKNFTATVGTGGTTVATFAKSGFGTGKYIVSLIKGVNRTSFEILVTYNDTASFGTVYGIVDAQAASQLASVDVTNTGSTIDLVIASASASTTAIIQGKALY